MNKQIKMQRKLDSLPLESVVSWVDKVRPQYFWRKVGENQWAYQSSLYSYKNPTSSEELTSQDSTFVQVVFEPTETTYMLESSLTVLDSVHKHSECIGETCVIHKKTLHSMRYMPQLWRSDRGIVERVCPHGVGHPDPDSPWPKGSYMWIHGCDGCCYQGEV